MREGIRKKIIIFVDWFLPGYKAGGQISSCANIVWALEEDLTIYIVTRDRDLHDEMPYPDISPDQWTAFSKKARIIYLTPGNITYATFKKIIKEVAPDTIYFNSMFSYRFTLLPLFVIKSAAYTKKLVLAPRGMLHAGALQFKSAKKKAMLGLLYHTGMLRHVLFHATDETERKDIQRTIKRSPEIKLVHDFPAMQQAAFTGIEKQPGYLKCLFVSRIAEKKNLLYLLRLLKQTNQQVLLTIAGPVEDMPYWEECQAEIKSMPPGCTVNYIGAIPNSGLAAIYRQHHLFVLPTFGENFGHVIFDSFVNGRPVLVSDQTPWQLLSEKKIGFDISLTEKEKFVAALEFFAAMNGETFEDWCRQAWSFGASHIRQAEQLKAQYQILFS